ncbi:hypothetical protein HMPREF7215_1691 [Pyramidobacter piscolens W5455]|uniref:Uncharacterized protein n=1 Tax=Pyramidobacter piscolens W5455 TaxID=352165 RepID=A0ABM9ZXP9_9BACT|nr:hypothetical protein HMPREF7215_1691 [Pyramidobacter piscolens W5455]
MPPRLGDIPRCRKTGGVRHASKNVGPVRAERAAERGFFPRGPRPFGIALFILILDRKC